MNILEHLKEDHQEALNLISELEEADEESGTDPVHTEKFNRLNEALKLHSQIEEELLYPAMEEIEEIRDSIHQAYKEHETFDHFLAKLSTKAPNQEEFQEILAELRSSLENHIEEEEGQLFPKTEEALEQSRLEELGQQMVEMKNDSRAAMAAMRRR